MNSFLVGVEVEVAVESAREFSVCSFVTQSCR